MYWVKGYILSLETLQDSVEELSYFYAEVAYSLKNPGILHYWHSMLTLFFTGGTVS